MYFTLYQKVASKDDHLVFCHSRASCTSYLTLYITIPSHRNNHTHLGKPQFDWCWCPTFFLSCSLTGDDAQTLTSQHSHCSSASTDGTLITKEAKIYTNDHWLYYHFYLKLYNTHNLTNHNGVPDTQHFQQSKQNHIYHK